MEPTIEERIAEIKEADKWPSTQDNDAEWGLRICRNIIPIIAELERLQGDNKRMRKALKQVWGLQHQVRTVLNDDTEDMALFNRIEDVVRDGLGKEKE